MRSQKVKDIIRTIAEEEKLSYEEVEKIVHAPFQLLLRLLKGGCRETFNFESLYIIKFGTFSVKPGRIRKLKELNEKYGNTGNITSK